MLCYRDKTFCTDDLHCSTVDCDRRLTEQDMERLRERWMPVSRASFKSECGKFKEPINANETYYAKTWG